MRLSWHAEGLREEEWLRAILSDVVDSEAVDLDLSCFDDDSLHVVSSNVKPLGFYDGYFSQLRARCKRTFLFHASDEWYSGGYRTMATLTA